MLINR